MAKYLRFVSRGKELAGRIDGDDVVLLEGSFPGAFKETGEKLPLSAVERYLPPVVPEKLIAIGLNYKLHAAEFNLPPPKEPVSFMLATSSLVGHEGKVKYPSASKEVSYEAELAIIIGRPGFQIPEGKALEHVFGYSLANDVSARDLQRQDGQWCRCKSYPTFTPLGPWIVTDFDAGDREISFRLNGETRQKSRTSDMIFSIPKLVAFLSSYMPLSAGDVIITGTPSGVGMVQPGDVMEVEIEGIGVLKNVVE